MSTIGVLFFAFWSAVCVYIALRAMVTGVYINDGYRLSKKDNPKKFKRAIIFTWLGAVLGLFALLAVA